MLFNRCRATILRIHSRRPPTSYFGLFRSHQLSIHPPLRHLSSSTPRPSKTTANAYSSALGKRIGATNYRISSLNYRVSSLNYLVTSQNLRIASLNYEINNATTNAYRSKALNLLIIQSIMFGIMIGSIIVSHTESIFSVLEPGVRKAKHVVSKMVEYFRGVGGETSCGCGSGQGCRCEMSKRNVSPRLVFLLL
jgi:hypothetical protein